MIRENAGKLIRLLKGKNAHVNLIPVNPVRHGNFLRPDEEELLAFQKTLVKNGINATIRKGMGADIEGACGQLKSHYLEEGGAI